LVYLENTDNIQELLPTLIELKDYIPVDFDEIAMVDKMRLNAKQKSSKKINSYTIFTTLDCNARCFYCYEKGTPHISMSEKTANSIADFIIRNSQGHLQEIRWFGGEPLVNEKVIDIITEKLNLNKVKFNSRMISNGLLFNKENIIKAKNEWHLTKVQITLDGTKEVYQRSKSFIGAKGNEFERVLNNIDDLLYAQIPVSIRLNQDLHNTEDLIILVDYLTMRFNKKKGLTIYNYLLFKNTDGVSTNTPEARYEAFLKLQDIIEQKGMSGNKRLSTKFKIIHCMADSSRAITITPNGRIGKCEHYPNDYLIGSIYTEVFNEDIVNKWKETYASTAKCKSCVIYPQCVRIKMCPVSNEECSLTECENKIRLIRNSVIRRYKKRLPLVAKK
jgi:radical SAM protein with 4Fe4S-binding SPASM domain